MNSDFHSEAEFSYSATTVETPATDTSLSTSDLKTHLHLTTNLHDTWLTSALAAAEAYVEAQTNRKLLDQVVDVYFDRFPAPGAELELPFPPVSAVSSVKYIATDGTLTTWDSAEYVVDLFSERAKISEAYGFAWPAPRIIRHAVVIRMSCGYADQDSVPDAIKHAIKLLISHWFNNREAAVPFDLNDIPFGVDALLATKTSKRFI